ncbi:shikimate dehydrogenase [Thermovibrio guaymasensis]|uniref:Shikimate dehydrogenase (NADP(+)) n=1 Tax=Thermovibrio guaymasensis TaxID=240167 RepID=A0A420W5X9_9BACT|nr:shikimate dehydrogenase [Thermovibrio guaymasensis]RKQ60569.1 shikimate dehydrogenase [Thermovibrio guaymasensis]
MKITGRTAVYGIIGYPVKHSLSPLMQTSAFQELGLDAVYVPFEVPPENLEDAVKGLRALSVRGFNVTVPHKEKVAQLVDYLTEDAEILGAVNTVKNEGGELTGYNTDAEGFLRSLIEEGVELEGKRALMFGAGGAARAVGYALLKGGVKFLNIVNRSFSKAKKMAEILGRRGNVLVYPLKEGTVEALLKDADIIVNTTSVGMKEGDPQLFDYSKIPSGITVVDIIYNPPQTPLLKAAKEKGCKTINGLGMLVHQGAVAFEIWTGKKAPVEKMKKVLEEELYGSV